MQIAYLVLLHECVRCRLDSSCLVRIIQLHCPSRSIWNYAPLRVSSCCFNFIKYLVLNTCVTTFNILYFIERICHIFRSWYLQMCNSETCIWIMLTPNSIVWFYIPIALVLIVYDLYVVLHILLSDRLLGLLELNKIQHNTIQRTTWGNDNACFRLFHTQAIECHPALRLTHNKNGKDKILFTEYNIYNAAKVEHSIWLECLVQNMY